MKKRAGIADARAKFERLTRAAEIAKLEESLQR